MRIIQRIVFSVLALVCLVAADPSYARGDVQQQPDVAQRPNVDDPIRELNLSPEQREKIRAIREQLKEERAAINQRLRETNNALEAALDVDNPDEALVEQRLRELAAAQAASMRMRVLSEVRIRRLLTPEQLGTLRTLRQNARDIRRQRQIENIRRESIDRRNQRNALGPLFNRRVESQRRTRP